MARPRHDKVGRAIIWWWPVPPRKKPLGGLDVDQLTIGPRTNPAATARLESSCRGSATKSRQHHGKQNRVGNGFLESGNASTFHACMAWRGRGSKYEVHLWKISPEPTNWPLSVVGMVALISALSIELVEEEGASGQGQEQSSAALSNQYQKTDWCRGASPK
jgi:hypothetical protein